MPARWFVARALLALWLVGLTSGCVHADLSDPRWNAPSTAFDRPEETEAGRELVPQLAAHPGASGLHVLRSGLDAFAARVLMIDAAEFAIDFQYYIFHDDLTGRFLLSRLLAAAERGVRVRILLDDLGSPGLDDLLSAANAQPNLEVRLFNAMARGPWSGFSRVLDLLTRPRRLNHRMHNKMLSVDGIGAVIGGRNIGDEYFDADPLVNFADTDLLAFGPVVAELGHAFDLYWNSEFVSPVSGWSQLRADPQDVAELRRVLDEHEAAAGETPYAARVGASSLYLDAKAGTLELIWAPAHVVVDLPQKIVARGDELEATLLSRQLGPYFEDAASELYIVSPYFIPRDRGVAYLKRTIEKGARVRILTNSLDANDVPLVHAAYEEYRKPMLEAGVELFELKHSGEFFQESRRRGLFGSSSASLHSKTFVFDGEHVFIGSLNLDPRSIDLNTEIGLVVRSEEMARERAAAFERAVDPEVSWRLSLDEDGDLVWEGTDGGEPVRHEKEPDTSAMQRMWISLLSVLPIEGQL